MGPSWDEMVGIIRGDSINILVIAQACASDYLAIVIIKGFCRVPSLPSTRLAESNRRPGAVRAITAETDDPVGTRCPRDPTWQLEVGFVSGRVIG